jgi:Tfp pilus assembly protein FimV
MATLEVEVPDHELAFLQKQLALMGYTILNAPAPAITPAEKVASPAQKTLLKTFTELKAAYTAPPQWASSEKLAEEVNSLRDNRWGPGL